MSTPAPEASRVQRLKGFVEHRSGLWLEVLRMSFTALRANKMRSGLTILGVIIGVTTVIGMVSLIQGLNTSMARQIQSFGTNTIYIRKWKPQIFFGEFPDSLRLRPGFTPEDKQAILDRAPAVRSVSALTLLDDFQPVRWEKKETRPMFVLGTDDNYQETNSFEVSQGRFFTNEEVRRRSLVCELGADTYKTLFDKRDPIGQTIRVGRVRFTVVGVLEPKGHFLNFNLDEVVMVPYTTLTKQYPTGLTTFLKRGEVVLNAAAVSPERVDDAIQEITDILRQRRGLRANQDNNFAVLTDDAILDLYHSVTNAFYFAMILIASIALLVGGIGVMNVMLISVTERTKEIGLRKAIGAKRGAILWQFLFEAMTLAGTGGAIGIALGLLIAKLIDLLTPLPSAAPLWSVIVAFVFSLGVGLFFGMYPAVRAAAMDPVDALRYE
ncbi:MAG TPA: ABC transporter permease [Candidatus Eisenbacteria bacterium]|nr:ABC transporter permease [Candidatus Eisenbacteria bacterium]